MVRRRGPKSGSGVCSKCGASIIWAWTQPGHKLMPLDVVTYDDEDVRATVASWSNAGGGYYCRVLSAAADPLIPGVEFRRMTHFATCGQRAAGTVSPSTERAVS